MYEHIKSPANLPKDPSHCGYKVWQPTRRKAREHARATLQGFVPYHCKICSMWHFRSKKGKHWGTPPEKAETNSGTRVCMWVWLKPEVRDSIGEKYKEDLLREQVPAVKVSIGKYFDLRIATADPAEALHIATKAAQTLLANTIVERFEVELGP